MIVCISSIKLSLSIIIPPFLGGFLPFKALFSKALEFTRRRAGGLLITEGGVGIRQQMLKPCAWEAANNRIPVDEGYAALKILGPDLKRCLVKDLQMLSKNLQKGAVETWKLPSK